MNSMKRFILNKTNWPNIIIIVLSFAGIVLTFISGNYFNALVCGMFSLVLVQNLFTNIFYLDDISTTLHMNSHNKGIVVKPRFDTTPISVIVLEAKQLVFISGIHLGSIIQNRSTLLKLADQGVKIQLLAMNLENHELYKIYSLMALDRINISLKHLESFDGYPNIEIRILDSIMPTMFVARDIGESSGYIKATHWFYKTHADNAPCIEVTKSDAGIYEQYADQIKLLWDDGKPLFREKV